ncbi:MAG TPA: thioredoxin domain-containing protein [Coriobacteriia bacterium]|nr:thioredoxin domain-containing protein [Coriobacteriia bacterium]
MANRLAGETSPYLRQHGEDPVDWYPWGEEAFAFARETGRPIFLSVGYASCHWCHVMHRESFSDPAVAAELNSSFVSVKVDRESRPDIDEFYMAYVTAATGHGGWPMSVFLTAGLVPVFGGTYYPPGPAHGLPSFPQVLAEMEEAFAVRADDVQGAAEESREYVGAMFAPLPYKAPSVELLRRATRVLEADSDPRYGGFGDAPKFPQAPVTDFLLAAHRSLGDTAALGVVERAGEGMVRGGIYDQAGGGIARYSVDERWLVPHFEKMLYDNAQLLTTLAGLHRAKPRDEWVHAIRQTVGFLDRELAVGGAYASSLDADTDGVEGATYVWSYDELAHVLDDDELRLAEKKLGVTPSGNWEAATILTRPAGRDEDADAVDALLDRLLAIRQSRPQPARDDKLIVSWNALTAIGLLDAGEALAHVGLTESGLRLVQHLLAVAVDEDSGVRRLIADPPSERVRVLEDAVALALAALRAHRTAPDDTGLLGKAEALFAAAQRLFYDGDGTWYLTPADTELPSRPREQHDSPSPSGPSLAALAALELAEQTGDPAYRAIAERTLGRMVPLAERSPWAAGAALQAMVRLIAAD